MSNARNNKIRRAFESRPSPLKQVCTDIDYIPSIITNDTLGFPQRVFFDPVQATPRHHFQQQPQPIDQDFWGHDMFTFDEGELKENN